MNKLENIVNKVDNLIDRNLPQTPEAIKKRRDHILRPAAVIAMGLTLFGGYKVVEANQGPTFSDKTVEHVIKQGEGLNDVALDIQGINTIDIRDAATYIKGLEQNQEALKDGLQPGEQIAAPEKVESN